MKNINVEVVNYKSNNERLIRAQEEKQLISTQILQILNHLYQKVYHKSNSKQAKK